MVRWQRGLRRSQRPERRRLFRRLQSDRVGLVVPGAGMRCQPKCGDGLPARWGRVRRWQTPTAMMGAHQRARLKTGYACTDPGKACHKTVCGDHRRKAPNRATRQHPSRRRLQPRTAGAEPNVHRQRGCTRLRRRPQVAEEDVTTATRSRADGCSADAAGTWLTCQDVVETTHNRPHLLSRHDPAPPTIHRPPPHPNFEVPKQSNGVVPGIGQNTLGDDREPVYNPDVDTTKS